MAPITIKSITSLTAPKEQTLHINIDKQSIKASLININFLDKDTGHYVYYIPGLELSGYGSTPEKAFDMIQFSVNEYFKYLLSLKTGEIRNELSRYGWTRVDRYHNKDFSKAYIDVNGELKNFNLEPSDIQLGVLTV